jgi:hypothetical protein
VHSVQEVWSAEANLPASQAVQALAPATACLPSAHFSQVPAAIFWKPALQDLHVSSSLVLHVLAEQSGTASQGVHVAWPLPEKVPASHSVHASVSPADLKPAAHCSQEFDLGWEPALHAVQTVVVASSVHVAALHWSERSHLVQIVAVLPAAA